LALCTVGRSRFVGVVEPDGDEGFITGRTTGRASVRLFANYNAQRDRRPVTSWASWVRTARPGRSRIRRCSRTPATTSSI
jgi:hypothetical protein